MIATGVGSLPGTDMRGALAAVAELFGQLIPLPELPGRGVEAGILGRGCAVLDDLPVDLGPGGWRLADSSDGAHRRAGSWLRRDLDDLEETLAGAPATVKIGICGPLTLAVGLHLRHGECLLADEGALCEVTAGLASGMATLMGELRRRMPQVRWVVQLDEPSIGAVLGGRVPTQSGLHHWPAMSWARATELTGVLVTGLEGLAEVGWHSCAADIPLPDVPGPVLLDLSRPGTRMLDAVAARMDAGRRVGLGVVPTDRADVVMPVDEIVRRVLELSRRLGVGDCRLADLGILVPACGLAGWSRAAASSQLDALARAAGLVEERLRS